MVGVGDAGFESVTHTVAIVGTAVGELTHQRITSARTARRRDYAVARLHSVGELIRQGRPLEEILEAFQNELAAELGRRAVRYEPGLLHRGRPRLRPNAALDSGGRSPASGVEVVVHCESAPLLAPLAGHEPGRDEAPGR